MPLPNAKLNDGHSMPPIAYGTGTIFRDKDVSKWIVQAIEMGFSHIDTAQMYNNEASTGDGIRKSGVARQDIFVTTKYLSGSIPKALHLSLSKLGLEYVDLYLIHTPFLVKDDVEGAWRQFEKLKEDGLARSIGVSNFDVDQLEDIAKIARIKPAVNQISLNPYNYVLNKSLLEYASQHGIIIESYNTLASLTQVPGGPVDAAVNVVAKRLGITPGQVLLSWAKAKGVVIVTTTMKKERLQEYMMIGDLSSLNEEDIAAIDEAGAVDSTWYRNPYL